MEENANSISDIRNQIKTTFIPHLLHLRGPKNVNIFLRLSLCPSSGDHWCEQPEEYPEELVSRIIDRLKEQHEEEQGQTDSFRWSISYGL